MQAIIVFKFLPELVAAGYNVIHRRYILRYEHGPHVKKMLILAGYAGQHNIRQIIMFLGGFPEKVDHGFMGVIDGVYVGVYFVKFGGDLPCPEIGLLSDPFGFVVIFVWFHVYDHNCPGDHINKNMM
jgi:hypothetical protein